MKRVCGIAIFFFGLGLITGLFLQDEFMKVLLCVACWLLGYCLFFR
ncbi:hypothetical protein [Anaerostipes sp.]